jgi:hypothetical protein
MVAVYKACFLGGQKWFNHGFVMLSLEIGYTGESSSIPETHQVAR